MMDEPASRDWDYYRYRYTDGTATYWRIWRGITERLNTKTKTWQEIDTDRITDYIRSGEIGLDRMTRRTMATAVGFALPD